MREHLASASHISVLEAWHLLSLDAPTVAALWAWSFARSMHIDLPWHAPLILALGTWLIYVADRILDGLRPHALAHLRRRHRFHAEHLTAFLGATIAVGAVLLWLIFAKMSLMAFREDTVLFLIALLYLFFVHRPSLVSGSNGAWFPKELAVALVFAAATAVPVWSRLQTGRSTLLPAIAIFAALCWLNCVAIERWESGSQRGATFDSHPTTRWAENHLRALALTIAAIAALAAAAAFASGQSHTTAKTPNTIPIYLSAIAAALCFPVIDREGHRFSETGLRIAADALLLTPFLFLPFLG